LPRRFNLPSEPAQSAVAPPNPIPAEASKPDPTPEPAPGTQPPAPAGSAAIPPEAPRFQEFQEDPIFEVKRGKAELTKNADGSRTLSRLDSRTHVKLRGATGTLRVLGVSGNSSLDASDLDAREIIFTGEIDGRSSVKLLAPNGRIEFRGLVTGRSQVTITAVNGIVIFGNPADSAPRTIIDDSCRLTIITGELNLAGTVTGMSTELFVGFPGEGVLKFRELAGNTRLVYDRAVGNFPEVHVEAGKIAEQAKLIRNR
jgi:hypothetical protein